MKSVLFVLVGMVIAAGISANAYNQWMTEEDYIQDQQVMEQGLVNGEEIFIFNNAMGKVTFKHTMHQAKWKCDSCHPAFPQKYDDSVSIKDVAHATCKTCHAANHGPTGCKDCHVK